MGSIATVFGSGPVGDTKMYYDSRHTFGLNGAALNYKVAYGITGHQVWYDQFREAGILPIVASPNFEGNYFPYCLDRIQFDAEGARGPYTDSDVLYFIRKAKDNQDILYPNRFTILHLAIYFLIKNGYTEIHLYGCDHNYSAALNSKQYDIDIAPQMEQYTQCMIRVCATEDIKIIRL